MACGDNYNLALAEYLSLPDPDLPPGFISGTEVVTNTPEVILPEVEHWVDIVQATDEIRWTLNVPADFENLSRASSTTDRRKPINDSYKLRHDFVCEAFGNDATDVPLREFFPVMGDTFDNLTPDFIVRMSEHNTLMVIEVGTCASNAGAAAALQAKIFKYEDPIKSRVGKEHVAYLALIVTPHSVFSNFVLPPELVVDLVLRMKIAMAIENKAKGLGVVLQSTDDIDNQLQMDMDRLKAHFDTISWGNVPDDGMVKITRDYVESLRLEPDMKLVNRLFCQAIKKVGKRERRKDVETESARVKAHYEEMGQAPDCIRYDVKSVVGMPLIIPKMTKDSTQPMFYEVSSDEGTCDPILRKLWYEAWRRVGINEWRDEDKAELLREALADPKEAIAVAKSRKPSRNKYHRVSLKDAMDAETRVYLAKDGIGAKKYDSYEWMRALQKTRSSAYKPDVDTSDIHKFIQDMTLLDEHPDELTDGELLSLKLLEISQEATKSSQVTKDLVVQWMRTRLYRAMNLITDIATELAVAVKQSVNPDQFIIKKLRYHDCHLLIKPTNSNSHVFYSILVGEGAIPLCGMPFRQLYTIGEGLKVTKFCSVRMDKIGNYINAAPRLLTLISFWADFYSLDFTDYDSCIKHEEFKRMINLCTLISLENKAETEETATLTRYMYMEVFKETYSYKQPDPFKVLSKLKKRVRSRLNMYLQHQVTDSFLRMIVNPPARVEEAWSGSKHEEGESVAEVPPQDKWNGLLNCYTSVQIDNATQAVNLMYIGYLKDKNDTSQKNSDWALVEKIVEEELKISREPTPELFGVVDDLSKLKGKGFSRDCVIAGTNILIKRLEDTYGPNWGRVIEVEILQKLSMLTTDRIASLKASANLCHSLHFLSTKSEDTKPTPRVKVIEAVASRLETFGLNPFFNFKYWLEKVENESQGVICDLFKKNQHGGLREIYVLTIESRVLQLFIETVARVICEHFPEETLTHPENKITNLDRHRSLCARKALKGGFSYTNSCNSSDKTRWNQNLVMTNLGIPLLKIAGPRFAPAIQRTLNLWADKLIRLPSTIIECLLKSTSLHSEVFSKLSDHWQAGERKNGFLFRSPRTNYLNLTTGMMQGILHYSSSLLHLAFLSLWKKKCLQYLSIKSRPIFFKGLTKKPIDADRYKWVMSSVCSSDDSATILSTFIPKGKYLSPDFLMFYDSQLVLHSGEWFCRTFGMVESVKSTMALTDYVEFNSEFIFRNTVCNPVIKFAAASLVIAQAESYVQRFYEMYNLISALNGSGMPSLNCSLVQWAQGILHYKSIGSCSGGLFTEYCESIEKYPDMTHGFFLLDPDYLAGVCGLSLSRYMMIRDHPCLIASLRHFNKTESEAAPDGSIVDSLNMKHGNSVRWFTLLDRVAAMSLHVPHKSLQYDEESMTWRIDSKSHRHRVMQVNEEPFILYNRPLTESQMLIKLISSVISPGVGRSLCVGNPLVQSFSSTPYALFTHCFTRTTISKEAADAADPRFTKETKQMSMLGSLTERIRSAQELESQIDREGVLKMCFPLKKRYDEIIEVLALFTDPIKKDAPRLSQKKNFILFNPALGDVPLSFYNVACNYWFGKEVKMSNSAVRRIRQHYEKVYPWFKPTVEESLEQSPFDTHVEMHGFLYGLTPRTRTFTRTGPAIRSRRLATQISSMIRRCSMGGRTFHIKGEMDRPDRTVRDRDLETKKLDLALMIPLSFHRMDMCSSALDALSSQYPTLMDWEHLGMRDYQVGCMALRHSGKVNSLEILRSLERRQTGIQLHFTQAQVPHEGEGGETIWRGPGRALVKAEGITMEIGLMDDRLTLIAVDNFQNLRRSPGVMKEVDRLLNNQGWGWNRGDPPHLGEPIGVWDGVRFCHKGAHGAKIYKMNSMVSDFEFLGLRVEFDQSLMKLCSIQGPRRYRRELQVLKYRPDSRWLTCDPTDEVAEDFWEAWCNGKQTTRGVGMLKQWMQMEEGREKNALGEFLRSSLKRRLIHRTLLSCPLMSEVGVDLETMEEQEQEEEIAALMAEMESMGIEGMDQFMQSTLGALDQAEAESDMDDDAFDRDWAAIVDDAEAVRQTADLGGRWEDDDDDEPGMSEDMMAALFSIMGGDRPGDQDLEVRVKTHSPEDVMYTHPLWDHTIGTILQQAPKEWFDRTFSGILCQAGREACGLIQSLFSIQMKSEEPSLDELLR